MKQEDSPHLPPKQLADWHNSLQEASRNNIWCHCRHCRQEWVASSTAETCRCGSRNIQYVHWVRLFYRNNILLE